jgi:PAS domain S-box-containing protein
MPGPALCPIPMPPSANLRFLDAPGELAARMRELDWSGSPLGPPDTWPQSLRSVVGLMLRSKFPMVVAWGPQLGFLYNDPYAPILGSKHPFALGQPFEAVWAEIWDDIAPLIERALAGEATYMEDLPLTMRRNGFDEVAYFTFSYSPVVDEQGEIAGMYCACTETTASVNTEKMRLAQVQRWQSLFEQAPGLFAVTRGRGHVYEIANSAYLEFIGRSGIVGLSVREALPELDQKFIDLLTEVFDTGVPHIGRRIAVGLQRSAHGGMEQRIVDFVLQPIVDDGGRVDGILIQGTDLTEQDIAERDAQIERRRLATVIESLPSGVILANAEGGFMRVNAANRAIWGPHPMSRDTSEYGEWKGWWADGSERRGQPVRADEWALARALRGETVRNDIVEVQPFDGGPRRTLLLQATPIQLEGDAIAGAVTVQTDVTDRMRAETALRESETRFRLMADTVTQILWILDVEGRMEYVNRQWEAYTGVPFRPLVASEAADAVVHPDDRAHTMQAFQQAHETVGTFEVEHRIRSRTGEYRWFLVRAQPHWDPVQQRISRWFGASVDIHDLKLAQRALVDADRRKDEFLAMLAHELRNPLAPISTAAHLLRTAEDPARIRAAGEVIGRQVRHMTELVDDLLDVSRVTRGLVELDLETVDVREVVAGAIEQVRPLVDARRHALHVRLPPTPLWVRGDRTRLMQVLTNLLNNAAKYTPEGGEVALEAGTDESQVSVRVRDTGQGIDPSLLPRIFELFTQAERTPDRAQGGLGIGLALVHRLVALHAGTITAYSAGKDRGATFTVCLPMAAPPADEDVGGPDRSDARPIGLDVVIVDDNEDAAAMLQSVLELDGHRVRVFHRALDALEGIVARPADVALLDVGLPDITGHELARRIRTRLGGGSGLLVALSGYGRPQDLDASREAGLDDHLVKPVDSARLQDVIARAGAAARRRR